MQLDLPFAAADRAFRLKAEATEVTQGTQPTEVTQGTQATEVTQATQATEATQATQATEVTQVTERTQAADYAARGFRLQAEESAPTPADYRTEFVRVRKARRYIIRIRPDGSLRVTIPRGGSRAEAAAFAAKHVDWILKERERVRRERAPRRWTHGTAVLLDGVQHRIAIEETAAGATVRYGDRTVTVADPHDVRREIEADLRIVARERLVPRLHELAQLHGLEVGRVTVRAQRSRWGSCSRRGAIALNFRLVQMPPRVRDYVLIHELMHLRQQNHGRRFWTLVERACPEYRDCERWLRRAGRALF